MPSKDKPIYQGSKYISTTRKKPGSRPIGRFLGFYVMLNLRKDEKGFFLRDDVLQIARDSQLKVHTVVEVDGGKIHFPYYKRTSAGQADYYLFNRSRSWLGDIEDIWQVEGFKADKSIPGLFLGKDSALCFYRGHRVLWEVGDKIYSKDFTPTKEHLVYLDACARSLPFWATIDRLKEAVPINKRGYQTIETLGQARLSAIRYINEFRGKNFKV
jgi:hypothetical protein